MARVGRFARGGTGGSNLSQLVYDLMRSQMTRQANAIVEAYMGQYDYRGMGVPTRDYVISFLREYLNNTWITQADRDQIAQNIAAINKEENRRIENKYLDAMNADPTDVNAVRDYIDFLKKQISGAESSDLAEEARAKLFNAVGELTDRVGKMYLSGRIDAATFEAQTKEALDEYDRGTSQFQQIMTKVVSYRYDAEFRQQNLLLTTAAGKGSDAYLAQLRIFKQWARGQVELMVAEGLAQVNEKGDVIGGIDAALDAQGRITDANTKLKEAGIQAAKEAATKRLNVMNQKAATFLEKVNQTLGSSYATLQDFAANQIDVNRFYSSAPASVMNSEGFMNRNTFTSFLFGNGNSLLEAAKAANSGQYKDLVKLSKNYGRNTLIDDAGIVFANWSLKTGKTNGDATENTRILEQSIASYEQIISQYGSQIPADELAVHQKTLAYMKETLAGNTPEIDGITAWDLVNPYGAEYNAATGQATSGFAGVVDLMASDAKIDKDIQSGKIISGYIGMDGKWKYGPAVDPENQDSLAYLDISTGKKRFIGVSGTQIKGIDQAGTTAESVENKGIVYNLGNGDFMVRGADGTLYKRNYDPFSKRDMTFNDFKALYTRRVTGVPSGGGEQAITQDPAFYVGDLDSDSKDGNTITAIDAITSGLDKRLEDLRSANNDLTPDAIDRIVSREIETAAGAFGTSPYAKVITDKYGSQILQASGSRTPSIALLPSQRDSYRADELTSYAFRNTPISQMFTPQQRQDAQNQFRAGERASLGISTPSRTTSTTPAAPGRGVGLIRL